MCFKWHRSIRQHDNGPWKTYMTCLTCSRAKTSGLHLGRLRQRRCERQKRLTNWQALGKHSQGMANRQFSFHPATELQFSLIDCQVWLGKSSFNQVVRHHVQHILLMFIVWYILSSWSNRGTSFLFLASCLGCRTEWPTCHCQMLPWYATIAKSFLMPAYFPSLCISSRSCR